MHIICPNTFFDKNAFLYLDIHVLNHYSFFTSASQMVQNKYI